MGGLKKFMPVTHITFLLACLAIAGIPPFSGFFSKDEILAAAYAKNPVYFIIGLITALMTAFYMFRLYATAFLGNFRGTSEQARHMHESPSAITIPLIILAILAVVGGFVGIPEVFAKDSHILHHFLSPVFEKSESIRPVVEQSNSVELTLMAVSVFVALVGTLYAWNKFSKDPELGEPQGFGAVLANKWYVDELYETIIVKPLNALGKFFNDVFEKSIIDGIVNGIGKTVQYSSRQLRLLQNGQVGAYVLMMVLGIVILFVIQIFLKK
jgi:NADH-quinone oxidoreductase subunit L